MSPTHFLWCNRDDPKTGCSLCWASSGNGGGYFLPHVSPGGARIYRDRSARRNLSGDRHRSRTESAAGAALGRNTQGVKLIGLSRGEKLVGVERVVEDQQIEEQIEEQKQKNNDEPEVTSE